VPDAIIFRDRSDEPLGVGHTYEVQFGFAGQPPAGSSDIPEDGAIITGRFSKITGLREEIERVAWRDGTEPFRVRHGPGTLSGGVVTFEKGIVRTPLHLLRWFTSVRFLSLAMENRLTRVDVNDAITPILIDGMAIGSGLLADEPQIPTGEEFGMFANINIIIGGCERPQDEEFATQDGFVFGVRRIGLFRCWPVAYQVSDLDASTSSIAIESLSVSFDEMHTGPALR
jgi:hypothetical protein